MANNDQSPEPDLTRQVKRLRCMRGGHRGTATRLVRSTKDSVGMLLAGDEDLPSRLIAAEIPRLVSARDSLINKREKLKELDSQIMSLMLEIDQEEGNLEGEIQSQDEYQENMTIAILEIESCLQHLNYAPSKPVAKEESRPIGKITEKAAQAQEDLKEEPEEDLQEEGEVCDEKLARSTSALGGTVQESSEVHARMHARDPSCGTEVSDEEAKVVLSDHPRKYESGYEERGFSDRPRRYESGYEDRSTGLTSTTQDPVNLLADTLARALGQIAVQSSRNELEQSKESASVEQLKKLTSRQTYGQQSLPTFDGDPTQWPSFIELVRTSTHECGFSNAENMGRLRKCLKGRALAAVQSMLSVPANFSEVLVILEDTFGHPNRVIGCMIEKVKSLEQVSRGDLSTLVDFSNALANLVNSVEQLHRPEHLANPQLREDLVRKLPPDLRLQWGEHALTRTDDVNLKTFSEWIRQRARAANYVLPTIATPSNRGGSSKPTSSGTRFRETTLATHSSTQKCIYCSKEHSVMQCSKLRDMSVDERVEWAAKQRRCFSCLGLRHMAYQCRKAQKCGVSGCWRRHHPLLHQDSRSSANEAGEAHEHVETVAHAATSHLQHATRVFLRIVPVVLEGPAGELSTYALLDDASTTTLVDGAIAAKLGIAGTPDPLTLSWTDASTQTDSSSQRIRLKLKGKNVTGPFFNVNARTVKSLRLPTQSVSESLLSKCSHLREVDVPVFRDAKPTILIGQDNCHLIVARSVREGPPNMPVASQTKLGWTLHGNHALYHNRADDFTFLAFEKRDPDLHEMIQESLTTENFGTKPRLIEAEDDQVRGARLQRETTKRISKDRWETGLLWREDNATLPDNRPTAFRRLLQLERKMDADPELAKQYCEKVDRYIEQGYAKELNAKEADAKTDRTWYLPHFGVFNPNKPGKLRLVFDAAARTDGTSLNDALLKGPDLLNPLPAVLFKFRQDRIAFTADIKEMFHQVMIKDEDRASQRFLWRGMSRDQPPRTFQMEAMTFGAVCSPSSAQYVKNRNAIESGQPEEVVKAIVDRHYVDDYLDSVPDVETATDRIRRVIETHRKGGFMIRHWTSNSKDALAAIPAELRADGNVDLGSDEASMALEKTLGLLWNPNLDEFQFAIKASSEKAQSKREVLRRLMSVIDTLGFAGRAVKRERRKGSSLLRQQPAYGAAVNEDRT